MIQSNDATATATTAPRIPLLQELCVKTAPPMLRNRLVLDLMTACTYLVSVLVFGGLVYHSQKTVQTITVVAVIAANRFDEMIANGYDCQSLSVHTGYDGAAFPNQGRNWTTWVTNTLCLPSTRAPTNCVAPVPSCPSVFVADNLEDMSLWVSLDFTKVYFAHLSDCQTKLAHIVLPWLDATLAMDSLAFTIHNDTDWFNPENNRIRVSLWSNDLNLNSTSVDIGDRTAALKLTVSSSLYWSPPSIDVCVANASNFDWTNRTVRLDSALDLWIRHNLRQRWRNQVAEPTWLQAICAPFQRRGPFKCTKQQVIERPLLQALGSSVATARTAFTVVSLLMAQIAKQLRDV